MEGEDFRKKGKLVLKNFINKDQNVNIFEKNIYEIINIISKRNVKLENILSTIKKGKLFWNNDFFQDMIDLEIEQDNFLIKPFEIEEGVLECRCGSKRVYSYQKQSRAADESSSTYATCVACNAKWVYSG